MVEASCCTGLVRAVLGALRMVVLGALCGIAACALASDEAVGTDDALLQVEARAHVLMRADPPQWDAAREAFKEAADAGSARAMSYLGWMYEHGHGVSTDKLQAAQWYERAANAGAHDYAIKLGWMHLAGDGVVADREQAEAWFHRAIAADHDPARVALASVLIADALGGRAPHRVSEARALLETAYEGGERLAAFFLARIHVEGIGGNPADPVLGARYTRIAAEDGHVQMQGWLALMHAKGEGVEADRLESAFWAALAASGGDSIGQALHAAYATELSPDERKLVMDRSLRWIAEREPGQ